MRVDGLSFVSGGVRVWLWRTFEDRPACLRCGLSTSEITIGEPCALSAGLWWHDGQSGKTLVYLGAPNVLEYGNMSDENNENGVRRFLESLPNEIPTYARKERRA